MSRYDFDQITDRRNTGSLKWDVAENELPMWVADMDFQTAPAVREAIEKRAAHGVFGYTDVEEDWYQAYMDWWERRHQFSIKKEWLTFCTGVVPAISSTVLESKVGSMRDQESPLNSTPLSTHPLERI